MAKDKTKAILPTIEQVNLLSPKRLEIFLAENERVRAQKLEYAKFAMKCGVASLIACLGSFTFLIYTGHDKSAAIIFGTTVIGLVAKVSLARLD